MIDYTILFNNDETFIKHHNDFDINLCIKDIYGMLKDKVKFKDIKLEISIRGFENTKFVITDKNRFS